MNAAVYNDSTNNSADEPQKFTQAQLIAVGFVLSTITLITIIGNLFIIAFFLIDKKLRSKVGNLFLLNLAISDLLVGTISMPISISWILHDYWPYGESFCKAYLVIDYVACFESVLSIILISLDRFLLVKLELRYNTTFTKNRALLLIAASWLIAILLYAPIILSWTAITGEKNIIYSEKCEIELVDHLEYTIATVVIELALPFFVIVSLNGTIYYHIRKRSHSLVISTAWTTTRPTSDSDTAIFNSTQDNGMKLESIMESPKVDYPCQVSKMKPRETEGTCKKSHVALSTSYNRSNRAAKSLFLIVSVFFICWFPFNIYALTVIICENCYNEHIWDAVNFILWFNSGINPFLYAICNRCIRDNFKRLLKCCRKRKVNITLN